VADKKKDDKKETAKDEAEEKASPEKEAKEGEAAEGEAKPEEGGKKKLPLKIIIIAGVGAVVLIGIIVGVLMFTGMLGGKKSESADASTPGMADKKTPGGHGEKESDSKKKEAAFFYDLGEMVVNLNTDGKRQTFLKLVVQLELESAADKPVIDNLKPRIVDNFQTYLRELRVDDLRGSAGLYRLREELLFRVSEAVHPVKIRDVLFQQMLVQ
jgi:flagellar FliL protein